MMFTPCWPRAGPTGGAGVALPAGICNFTWPITFFAIAVTLCLLHLKKIQFHRRRTAENRHHDLQRVSVRIHIVDNPLKLVNGPSMILTVSPFSKVSFGFGLSAAVETL